MKMTSFIIFLILSNLTSLLLLNFFPFFQTRMFRGKYKNKSVGNDSNLLFGKYSGGTQSQLEETSFIEAADPVNQLRIYVERRTRDASKYEGLPINPQPSVEEPHKEKTYDEKEIDLITMRKWLDSGIITLWYEPQITLELEKEYNQMEADLGMLKKYKSREEYLEKCPMRYMKSPNLFEIYARETLNPIKEFQLYMEKVKNSSTSLRNGAESIASLIMAVLLQVLFYHY
ncbi:uncharacterized protein LOC121401444 [Xenopus laevis]|uniref:Uncharacterized protein LOC121401444 n=1 Tax=Xenopus laevis TaxID=8355 RepID=A0A8J1MKZ1_XENLA|nr:uncharacterized protein LOC121401444 [Xenopus laevis]XP_041442077.1 uncharacterized protein LOC121401444 [Xenopus laevis]